MKVSIEMYRQRRWSMRWHRHNNKPLIRQILYGIDPIKIIGIDYLTWHKEIKPKQH